MFADAYIAVVDKPSGQHSQGTAAGDAGTVIAQARSLWGDEVRLVHRLDRDASGLLVLARTKTVAGILGLAFREHAIQRTYRARVAIPLPVGHEGTIDQPLKWAGGRCWVDKSGARSVTHYRVLARVDGATELEVRLETGRMHQIRVHLKHALAPILGDVKYGGRPADHLWLRAVCLELEHPATGEALRFEL